jgi:HD-like signal output (HDOD) protein
MLFLQTLLKVDPTVLAKSVERLPSLPHVALQVQALARDPDSSPLQLLRTINSDPSLAAVILKTVNSAAYGLPRKIDSLDRAIPLLGLKTVSELTIAHSVGALFTIKDIGGGFTATDLWMHSNLVASVARKIATFVSRRLADSAYVAGLLHDMGLLVLCQQFGPQQSKLIADARTSDVPLTRAEVETYGFDHADLGVLIMSKWQLPETTCAAVAMHHDPLGAPEESRQLAAIIALADTMACASDAGLNVTARLTQITPDLLAAAGVDESQIDEIRDEMDSLTADLCKMAA